MRKSLPVLLLFAVILLVPQCAWGQNAAITTPVTEKERAALLPTFQMIETGRTVADAACAQCHGLDGLSRSEGQPHLAGQRAIYLYRVLSDYHNSGRDNETSEHASNFLNDESMLAVAAYYASLRPAPAVVVPEEEGEPESLGGDPFTGIRKSLRKCTKCHDETGNSEASGMPSLTAQSAEYFVTSMNAYVDGGRKHKLMKKLVGAMDESTIKEMGLFYAVQKPLITETQGEGDIEAGAELAEDCAICHGADGNAQEDEMPTVAGQDARYFIKAMQAYKDGKRVHENMFEAVEALNDSEISDLAAFYAAQQPLRRDVRMPFTSAEWVERCERCHGIDGNSTDPRFPMLAGQDRAYLKKALQDYAAGGRLSSTMHAMADPLSNYDIKKIVNHYATREPKSVVYVNLPCADGGKQ
jgi:cytochrome c553